MKNRIYRKIKDNSGMSLIAALLYFAFCTIIGTVLLAVAGTAAGRISQVDTGAEERYQLVSAANLMAEKMGARTFRTARTLSKTYEVDKTEDPQNVDFTGGGKPYPERNGDLLSMSGKTVADNLMELEDNMVREIVNEKWGNGEVEDEDEDKTKDWLFKVPPKKDSVEDSGKIEGWKNSLSSSKTPPNRTWDIDGMGTENVKYQVISMTPKRSGSSVTDEYQSIYARIEMDENFQITAYLYMVEGADEKERNKNAKEEGAYRKSPLYLIVRIPAKKVNVKYEQIVKIEKVEPEESEEPEDPAAEEENEPELFSVHVIRKVNLSEIGWKDAVITVIDPKDAEEGD